MAARATRAQGIARSIWRRTIAARRLDSFRPTVIFHLAAQTFVPESLRSPAETYEINVMGTVRLAEAVRAYAGGRARAFSLPVLPKSTGGATPASFRCARRSICVRRRRTARAKRRPRPFCWRTRAASISTSWWRERSTISDRVRTSASWFPRWPRSWPASLRGEAPHLLVGNLGAARDFLDVRDVVAAYVALATDGERGEVYNVCSGKAVTIRDVLRELIAIARVPVEVREDPLRFRSAEIPLYVGDPQKLRERTGWQPGIPLVRSLRDVYAAAQRGAGVGGHGG